MTKPKRIVRVAFRKNGPLLSCTDISVLPSDQRNPNDLEIQEEFSNAYMFLYTPGFPPGEMEQYIRLNSEDWRKIAEDAYREKHSDKNIVFRLP